MEPIWRVPLNLISFSRKIFAWAFQTPSATAGVTLNSFVPLLFITSTVRSKDVQHSRWEILYITLRAKAEFCVFVSDVRCSADFFRGGVKIENISPVKLVICYLLWPTEISDARYPEWTVLMGNNAVVWNALTWWSAAYLSSENAGS